MHKEQYLKRLQSIEIENGAITDILFFDEEKNPLSVEGIVLKSVPARCEVYATLKPTDKSNIKIVVGLPISGWNGRFLGTGNGGAAGSLVMQSVKSGVARGFATANTDLGTSDGDDYMHFPEKLIDFGHRATHLMTVIGKRITEAFYDKQINKSYFIGSSTGGGQAMHEAQKYPNDYDGIVAFSPANNRVNLHQSFVWYLQCTCISAESRFTYAQINEIERRIVEKYAVLSGGAQGDNFLSYPGKIDFSEDEIDELVGGLNLYPEQVRLLKTLHKPPKILECDQEIFKTLPLGCENAALMIPYFQSGFENMLGFLHRWALGADFDYQSFDFGEDYVKMITLMREHLDAMDADLSKFKDCGNKLILITGSADALVPYSDGQEYYKAVIKKMNGLENVSSFFRYFHIPGLAHGTGGPGLQEIGCLLGLPCIPCDNEHDVLEAVILWVEENVAPERLLPVALKNSIKDNAIHCNDEHSISIINGEKEIDYERPVYPFPCETEYIGGDRKNVNNFRRKVGDGVY